MKFIDKKISESFYQIYIIIDDKEKNVIGAKSLGINGIVYKNNEIREKVISFFS